MPEYTFITPHYRTYITKYIKAMPKMEAFIGHFAALDELPRSEFLELCKQRVAIALDLRRNEMMLKLRKGEIPFVINHDDYESVSVMAERHGITPVAVMSHLEHLQYTGMVTYYNRERIVHSFWLNDPSAEDDDGIEPFAVFQTVPRKLLNELSTEEYESTVGFMMEYQQVLLPQIISDGRTVWSDFSSHC